jgi:hypothetical protein
MNGNILGAAIDFAPAFADASSTGTAALAVGMGILGLIVAISYGRKVLRALGAKI